MPRSSGCAGPTASCVLRAVAAGGMGLSIVGKLLGHAQAQTTALYGQLDDDPLRRASERIANTIADALEQVRARLNHKGRFGLL